MEVIPDQLPTVRVEIESLYEISIDFIAPNAVLNLQLSDILNIFSTSAVFSTTFRTA